MAEFVLTDLPRELSEAEAAYLTSLCSDAIRRWDHEAAQPSHICKRKHGGAIDERPDLDEAGERVRHGGIAQATRRHRLEARCHDCGRELVRPPGSDAERWLCPAARQIREGGAKDNAIECGERR